MDASIVIPTYQRNRMLARALESCLHAAPSRADRSNLEFEVLVIDNSPSGMARETVEEFAARGSLPVFYHHERSAGISHARNRGVREARGKFIAFLDDDEEAHEGWLNALVDCQRELDADIVFGAVIAAGDGPIPEGMNWVLGRFTRDFPDPKGPLAAKRIALVGTGNSLFRRSAFESDSPFPVDLGLIGGEDTAVIQRVLARGGKAAWCPEARVFEYLPPARFDLRAMLRHRFSLGQGRTYACVASENPSRSKAALWMALGAAQALGNAALATSGLVLGREAFNARLGEVAGGLGKVFWMKPFRVVRYARSNSSS